VLVPNVNVDSSEVRSKWAELLDRATIQNKVIRIHRSRGREGATLVSNRRWDQHNAILEELAERGILLDAMTDGANAESRDADIETLVDASADLEQRVAALETEMVRVRRMVRELPRNYGGDR
jgi:hypothetical protein